MTGPTGSSLYLLNCYVRFLASLHFSNVQSGSSIRPHFESFVKLLSLYRLWKVFSVLHYFVRQVALTPRNPGRVSLDSWSLSGIWRLTEVAWSDVTVPAALIFNPFLQELHNQLLGEYVENIVFHFEPIKYLKPSDCVGKSSLVEII